MIPSSRTLKYKKLLGGISMSRKSKFDPVLKVKLVERYLRNEIGMCEAARLAGLSTAKSFDTWVRIYRNEGPYGLLNQKHNKSYSTELMLAAVTAYLSGEGSLRVIAERFKIRSEKQLRSWIKVYNTHGEIKSRGSGGGSYMRKAKQTTSEERTAIATQDPQRDTIIHKLLSVLVFHHRQRVARLTMDSHMILLAYPLNITLIGIFLHLHGSLGFHLFYTLGDDVVTFLFATTGHQRQAHHGQKQY